MKKDERVLYGRDEIDTGGKHYFIQEGCPFCSVLTSGDHEWFCPNRENKYIICGEVIYERPNRKRE